MERKLYNRYGENLYLEEISDYRFVLKGNTDWCRIIFANAEMTSISAIDPSGGPYMGVDSFSIDNNTKVLDKIEESESGKFILTFRNDNLHTHGSEINIPTVEDKAEYLKSKRNECENEIRKIDEKLSKL